LSQIPIDVSGQGIGHTVDTYDTGTFEGIINIKITGFGAYIYEGPNFTYDGVTVQAGDTFGGLLLSAIAVKHGTSGELDGLQMRGTWTAVLVRSGPPQLLGKSILYETGIYW
jgi:hypothetical protein